MKYIGADEVNKGMMIYLSHTSTTPARVTDVREPTHPLAAAAGGVVVTIELYQLRPGCWGIPRDVTLWPRKYRLETEPDVWTVREPKSFPRGHHKYRITLDVYHSRQPYPSLRVSLDIIAVTARAAREQLRTVYVSADGRTVNTWGGVGPGGYAYNEWDFVSCRKGK